MAPKKASGQSKPIKDSAAVVRRNGAKRKTTDSMILADPESIRVQSDTQQFVASAQAARKTSTASESTESTLSTGTAQTNASSSTLTTVLETASSSSAATQPSSSATACASATANSDPWDRSETGRVKTKSKHIHQV